MALFSVRVASISIAWGMIFELPRRQVQSTRQRILLMQTNIQVTNKTTRFEPDFTPTSSTENTEIVLLNGHKLRYTDSVKNRMTDVCPVCQEALFSEEKGIIERPCQHFEHQECMLRRIAADNRVTAINTCTVCVNKKPNNKENIFYNKGTDWLIKADRICEREGCLYVRKQNDKAEAPDCPYPYSMFPDHGNATGFLHQYGKLVDNLIVTQLGHSGIKAVEFHVDNITEERQNEMERKYGKENDLGKLAQQLDENHRRAEECLATLEQKFNQDFEYGTDHINSENMMNDSEKNIRDRIREAKQALTNKTASKCLIDLRTALENDREHSGSWGSPEVSSMIALSNPNPHELIPGLAESTDVDFALVRNFTVDGVNHPFEVRVDTKNISESKSVNETVTNIINCVRCELMMSKLMKSYPAYFDDKTKVYLKTPFDYWGDKIEIVCSDNKEQTHVIKLSEVFDFEKKEFNFTVFLDAVDEFKNHGINRHDLRRGSKLPSDQRPTGRCGMPQSNFDHGSGGIASGESSCESMGLFGTWVPPSRPGNVGFTISSFPPSGSSLFGTPSGSGNVGLTEASQVPSSSSGFVRISVSDRPEFTGSGPATTSTVSFSEEAEFIGFGDIL